jgi:hypothetical protein
LLAGVSLCWLGWLFAGWGVSLLAGVAVCWLGCLFAGWGGCLLAGVAVCWLQSQAAKCNTFPQAATDGFVA